MGWYGTILHYTPAQVYTLTMAVNGSGSTNPPVGAHTYLADTVVSITATPTAGWQFVNWTGDVADLNSATTTVTMNGDKTVTANFTREMAVLEVETSIGEEQGLDKVVVIPVTVVRVKDPITHETVPGVQIADYVANLTFTPGFMELLDIRGGDPPFDTIDPLNIIIDNLAGTASVSDDVSPDGALPLIIVFQIVARLTGSALVSDTLSVNVVEVSAPGGGIMNAQAQPMVLTFQRGDIRGNGGIDIIDAMFGAQYIVGFRPVADIRQLNMASVKHDDNPATTTVIEPDKKDIIDCMFIAQYVVGIRNEYFELVP